jgi:hypothetical protein
MRHIIPLYAYCAVLTLFAASALAVRSGHCSAAEAFGIRLRATCGTLGATRSALLVAGIENLYVDIAFSGLGSRADGTYDCSFDVRLLDMHGRVLFEIAQQELRERALLGGGQFAVGIQIGVPPTTPPGNYRLEVQASDRVTGAKAKAQLPCEVRSRQTLAAANIGMFYDGHQESNTGSHLIVGSRVRFRFDVVGFVPSNREARVEADYLILDHDKKPLRAKPVSIPLPQPAESDPDVLPACVDIAVNRAGAFILRLEVRDIASKKKVSYDIPLVAVDTSVGHANAFGPRQKDTENLGMQLRLTYGLGGTTRPATVVAGEGCCLAATIGGLTLGRDGSVDCTLEGELLDPSGKQVIPFEAVRLRDPLAFGGRSITYLSRLRLSAGNVPGDYRLRMRVTDRLGSRASSGELKLEVKPLETFSAVNPTIQCGRDCTMAGSILTVGQYAFVNLFVGGYAVKDNRPRITVTYSILDAKKQAVTPRPITLSVDTGEERSRPLDPKLDLLPACLDVWANRPGSFTLHVDIHDEIADKKLIYDLPFLVAGGVDSLPIGKAER